ncbi:hypothetical protein ACGFR6_09680 [Streptomyces sp. NPDC048567]|uniref:hypothetical protein n=1 Tax=Streptomyces sp. NPDC048567 TaxID=3365570 RepID=UPI003716FC29
MTSPLLSLPLRKLAAFGTVAALCLFAWWAVQPAGGSCPDKGLTLSSGTDEGLTLSSDPYGSTYGPDHDPDYDPCAQARHPRLYGWFGL